MEEIGKEKLPFSKIHHVCIVVKDIDKAKKYYESLGIGPFQSPEAHQPEEILRRITYKEIFAPMGQIKLQLLEPSVEGDDVFNNVFRMFLDNHGEGVHHVGFLSDDLDKDVANLVEKGYKLIDSFPFQTGGGEAFFYFDSDGDASGVCLQLIAFGKKGQS